MDRVSMGTWIAIDADHIHYNVCQDEVEFEVGGRGSGAELVATEAGLVNLISRSTEALAALRAAHES
ncbi:hypothetical protein FHX42_004295 [Saccharopolyspora lacisalsi]|uniref:Uncharacterized protein n=1 Tax=Halosaccharopolyspora lacisalsi TaxID=1000566 RepID=A0A839E2W6_9PSEU|nr:hypothetical protein [Halosaccharopolyspora lacisalsi]MBA8826916.1 hypothetical protein [Halosaccharopolyspora lacisalsi]